MSYKKLYTLVFARKNSQILLGLKKRGFGKGRWNGFGGKVETEETVNEAAIREMKEECGLIIQEKNLNYFGNLEFHFQGEPLIMIVKVFSTFIFEGDLIETDEMKPKWFNTSAIPFKDMWPDDRYWLDYLLKDIPFTGTFWFHGHNDIIRQELRQISKEELYSMEN